MRIISGKWKGRRIQISNQIKARPTTDFAKEGLFNLLNNQIDFEGIETLDLFAGTGSISLELISRGCLRATAVELNDKHCAYIRKAAELLGAGNLNLIKGDVFKFIAQCRQKFDLIFIDPPYDLENLETIPGLILKNGLLKEDGILIMEHGSRTKFDGHPGFESHRHYGNVNFSFFSVLPTGNVAP